MRRMLDLECRLCGKTVRDVFFRRVPKIIRHTRLGVKCKGIMDQVFLPSARNAGWSDKDAVVVFRKPDGTISYPATNLKPTPAGCERIVMKSLREVEQFEKRNHVICEAAHYDSGNGVPTIDHIDTRPPVQERERAFMKAWRGE